MIRLVIINPYSGNRRGEKYAKTIKKVFNNLEKEYKLNDNVYLEYTEYVGHAEEISLEYCIKYKNQEIVIYIVGGDGTVSEVSQAIKNQENVSMLVIPKGTGNDFAKAINSYKSIRKIIKTSLQNSAEKVDAIDINHKVSANMVNVGLDAAIGNNVNHFRKIPFVPGSFKYKLAIAYTIFSPVKYKFKIRIDDKVLKGKYTLVAIGNNKYCGGGVNILPDADIQDGKLDVCIVKNTTLVQKLIYLPKLMKGKHKGISIVNLLTCKKISIVSNKKYPVSIDGEITFTNKLNAKIAEKSLSVIKTLDK